MIIAKRKSSLQKGGDVKQIFKKLFSFLKKLFSSDLFLFCFVCMILGGFILFVCIVSGHLNHGTKLKSLCKDIGHIEKEIFPNDLNLNYCDIYDSEMDAIKTQIQSLNSKTDQQKNKLISKLNEIEEKHDNWGKGVQFKCKETEDTYTKRKCYAVAEYGKDSLLKTSEQAWDDKDFYWPFLIVIFIGLIIFGAGSVFCSASNSGDDITIQEKNYYLGMLFLVVGLILLIVFSILISEQK
jgi:hypothetical protein